MLYLRRNQEDFIHKYVESCLPEEGCGLIGGKEGRAEMIITVTNADHSPSRFYMDERELVSAYLAFEEAKLDFLAIFHSHPVGPKVPSETDLQSLMYYHPGILSVILVKKGDDWQTRAFEVNGDSYKQVNIRIG